ncbi:Lipoprotein LipO precursor [Paenibacillus konkukensis]|uniref:Lipoprotein LipO n=1 Tax=Paenibacillus konkukensis TaxID=2020716 RepID=A0ABY4RXL1_9BACL|nr:extracellular solute-binding protein [Paenibacillus konkukensis]UQZ86144.1 Lipoprotein LipO precursor [Paenibacillus konkukensis]
MAHLRFGNKILTLALSSVVCYTMAACGTSKSERMLPKPDAAKSSEQAARWDWGKPFTLNALSNTPREIPDLDNRFWTKVQDLFKVKLQAEFVPLDDYETRLRLVLSSGSLPEVLVVNTLDDGVFTKAVKQGMFWELGELAGDLSDFPNLAKNIPEEVWKYTSIDGKRYVIPRVRPLLDGGLHWRPDLFRALGLPEPATLDDYIGGLKQIVDAYPERQYVGLHFEESFFGAFGGFEPVYNGEGGLVHKYFTDAYTDFVAWYRSVYAMGLMSKEFAVLKGSDKEYMFRSDKALTFQKNMYHSYTYDQDLKKLDPQYEAGVITYLNGPDGHTGEFGVGYTGGFVISREVPKEKALRILHMYNQAVSPEVTEQLLHGFQGIHYRIVGGERVPTELAQKEISNAVMQIFPNALDPWQKVINTAAPKEWNDRMIATARTLYDAEHAIDPFRVIRSETWLKEWPKVQDEYIAMRTAAIMGVISMDEYREYVGKQREQPQFRKAFLEFAESYELMFQ